jgi:hypothetical protein
MARILAAPLGACQPGGRYLKVILTSFERTPSTSA